MSKLFYFQGKIDIAFYQQNPSIAAVTEMRSSIASCSGFGHNHSITFEMFG
jgi:hypothetical protein